MDLKTARTTLTEVAEDLGISVGGTTRGQFGGDGLVMDLAYRVADFTVSLPGNEWTKTPAEAARIVRAYARRRGLTPTEALPRWFESQSFSRSSTVAFALVEPLAAQADELAHWRTPAGQDALVRAAAENGVTVELAGRDDDGYVRTDCVPVAVLAAPDAILAEYRRQVLVALGDGGAA